MGSGVKKKKIYDYANRKWKPFAFYKDNIVTKLHLCRYTHSHQSFQYNIKFDEVFLIIKYLMHAFSKH